MSRKERAEAGGDYLTSILRRRAWSSSDLARRSGDVSGSSVAAWAAGQTLPNPQSAKSVAVAIGLQEGGLEWLRQLGYDELADALNEADGLSGTSAHYTLDDSATPLREVPIGWRISGTVVGRTSYVGGGVAYVVELDSGTIVEVRVLESIEVAQESLDRLRS